MKIISRKKYEQWKKELLNCKAENYILREKVKVLENNLKSNDDFFKYILSFKSNSLEAIVENKIQKKLYLVKSEDEKNLELYLYELDSKRLCSKLLTTKSEKYELINNSFEKQCNYIYIDDFNSEEENVGNGTILMSYLLDYLKNKEFSFITGYLSPIDRYNREKQEYFYKKYEFEVVYKDEDKYEGRILLSFKDNSI